MSRIQSASSQLSIAYVIALDQQPERRYWVSVVSANQIAYILRGVVPDSVLVVALAPKSFAATFMRGQAFDVDYVAAQTGLPPYEAGLLAAILPQLTRMVLPSDILQTAERYVASHQG